MTVGWFARLPNFISIARLVLAPVVIDTMVSGRWRVAFFIFLAAVASDGLDGWLARTFSLRSELGALLDALADKVLIVSVVAALLTVEQIPVTLAILVISRDVMIVGAVVISSLVDRPLEIRPLLGSKTNTLAQFILLAAFLAKQAFQIELGFFVNSLEVMVAVLTIASGSVYLWRWVEHMSSGGS
jgi:cardiolipin synthase